MSPGPQPQLPAVHTRSGPQAVPQAPQWVALVSVSTHVPEQSVRALGHAHVPALQVPPVPHAFPHAPQCTTSLDVSMHRSSHSSAALGGQAGATTAKLQLHEP
ncbi:MAG: hypothetical protein M5U28_01655 [Sandaracinaceae bacterium]|nr:hypothetical protein [Sandaracinaceae bacterium]